MDAYEAIAKNYSGWNKSILKRIEPPCLPDVTFPLSKGDIARFEPYKKIDTKEELYSELARLKEKMRPFLENCAPEIKETEKKIELNDFEHTVDGSEKTRVRVPHYGGPVGKHTAVYETFFDLEDYSGKKVFIAFGGVDYKCKVFVNDVYVGQHEGFFAPFEVEITDAAKTGSNNLKVYVENDYRMKGNMLVGYAPGNIEANGDKIYAATGMGWDDPNIGWHHSPPGMGIYQKVFVIIREKDYITDIFPRVNDEVSEIWIECYGDKPQKVPVTFRLSLYGYNFIETCFENMEITPNATMHQGMDVTVNTQTWFGDDLNVQLYLENGYNRFIIPIDIANKKIWSPETPYLYQIQCSMIIDGEIKSTKTCNFGIRDFVQDLESEPKGKFYLNGKEIKLFGVNTNGYDQQDVFKEDYEQLIDDILLGKLCNENFWRITQRPVQPEVYDYCDRLGMMVQTDFPLFGLIRVNAFDEIIKQAGEMEKLVRSHPCCIMDTYINEPFPNCYGSPHRFMIREQMEALFDAMDIAVRFKNPDRVIKHVDGDYDPPCKSMPDNHLYSLWYNGHAVEFGELYKGYWCQVKEGWHIGCGEYGSEGLDFPEVMEKYYPKEWLPERFKPNKILGAQTWKYHRYFYETPSDSMEEWSIASQAFQAFANKEMTAALRRNKMMNTCAIFHFIDTFPGGWMKAIMDFKRNPKPAYFACRDCFEPIFCNLRSDRWTFFEKEKIKIESYVCCDSMNSVDEVAYMVEMDQNIIYSGRKKAENDSFQGFIEFEIPSVSKRQKMKVYMAAFYQGKILHYASEEYGVFPHIDVKMPESISYEEFDKERDILEKQINDGKRIVLGPLKEGKYNICGQLVDVKDCDKVHFVSRDTGHCLVNHLEKNDFRFLYDKRVDRIAPILYDSLYCENAIPVFTTIRQPGRPYQDDCETDLACCEIPFGKGSVIINQLHLQGKEDNPVVTQFLQNLYHYINVQCEEKGNELAE